MQQRRGYNTKDIQYFSSYYRLFCDIYLFISGVNQLDSSKDFTVDGLGFNKKKKKKRRHR